VSLRLDYLARAARKAPNWLDRLGDGYVFADLSPGGGAMLLLVSGPPFAVVGNTLLNAAQVAFITTALDEQDGMTDRLAGIDSLLRSQFSLN
jgi:hypothetical protein